MGLTYGTNLMDTTSRRTLAAAVSLLAAMVLLLWFGSLRTADTVSADGSRSLVECPETPYEQCEEASMDVRPLVLPNSESAGRNYGTQEIEGRGFPGIPALENTGYAIGVHISERCLLPGIHCFNDAEYAASEQGTSDGGLLGISAFESAGYSGGEQNTTECFLTIPCLESELSVIGEQWAEGQGFQGNIALQ